MRASVSASGARRGRNTAEPAMHSACDFDTVEVGSAEYYRRREEGFDQTSHTQKIYSKGTEGMSDWMKELWYQYCDLVGKEPIPTLRAMPIQVLDNFFHFVLHNRRDSLRSASTLQTYWNVFTLMRRKETGIVEVDLLVKSQMHGVRQRLAAEFKLSTEKKPKSLVRAEDEFELLKILWGTNRVSMAHERLRVQLALVIQLAGITGSRPSALMSLTYGNFALSLLRDPLGGEQPRLIVDVTFTNTKSFLGPKAPNTIPIPQVPSEPCLLLCPQIMLLGLIFADGAFECLDSPEQLFSLRVPPGLNEQRLPIKEEWQQIPVFRRLKINASGHAISPNLSTTSDWFRDKLGELGMVTGVDPPVGPYCFRRGAGEAFDSSSHISDAQRNLVLQHASSAVFQNSYLSKYITADVQAAYRGLEPQSAIMRVASGMSRTIDPRRPTALTDEQQVQVAKHPEVKLLRRHRLALRNKIRREYGSATRAKGSALYEAYRGAQLDYQRVSKAVRKAMITESRRLYRKQQPGMDIRQQLGSGIKDDSKAPQVKDDRPLSNHRRAARNALLTFVTSDPCEESKRRSRAVDAVAALSHRREPIIPKVCRPRTSPTSPGLPSGCEDETISITLQCLPTQCIFCLGATDLSSTRRTNEFHSRSTLRRHFLNKHLKHYRDDEQIRCPHPLCDLILKNKMHLRNHAATVHKTNT